MRRATILILSVIVSFIFSSVPRGEDTGTDTLLLKVMTINLRHNKDFWEERFPLVADEIVRLKPDIIGLQEVAIGIDQSKHLRDLIREKSAAAGEPLTYYKYEQLKTGEYYFYGEGIGILSRFPMLKTDFADLENGRPVVLARIKIADNLTVDMYNTHLHHMGGDEVRLPQAEKITQLMKSRDSGHLTFLTGDMNSSPDSKTIKHFLEAGFTDSFMAAPEEARTKNPNTSPVILSKTPFPQSHVNRIDFVFVKPAAEGGPAARPVSSEVCFQNHAPNGLYPSDHLGVMTTFEISLNR